LSDAGRGLTVNVGLFSGGSSANTVPAEARCEIDFRYVRTRDGEDLVGAVDRLARDIGAATEVRFEITGGIRRPPLERTEASAALYQRYARCAQQSGLGGGECPLVGGGSDGNTLSAIGVPVIDALGPRGRGFHTHDEYIEPATLPLRVAALIRFIGDRA
jgi:glutamate carboxypeptidase